MSKRKRTIRAGRLCMVTLASMPLPRDPDYVRADKSRCTSLAQQRLNLKYSCQKLELLLAANFGSADFFLTLTYDDDHLPETRAAAVRRLQKFIRQLRAHRRARGQEVKYVYVTEGLHDKRLHHHMVVSGEADAEVLRSLWPYGMTDCKPIDPEQIGDLARYLTKEPRDGIPQRGKRCWSPSRNLAKPETSSEIVSDDMTLTPPPGAIVIERDGSTSEWGEYVYIKYLLPEPAARPLRRASRSKRAAALLGLKPCLS